jgi:hypothetical protein
MRISNVKFYGCDLACVVDESGQIWVVVKNVCDAIGLDSDRQIQSISEDEVLKAGRAEHPVQVGGNRLRTASEEGGGKAGHGEHLSVQTGVGQLRKMICLSLDYFSGWLFRIKITNTMKEETRKNLIRFQKEAYGALFEYFFGKYSKREKSLCRTNELQKERMSIVNSPAKTLEDFDRYLEIERSLDRERRFRRKLTNESMLEMNDLFDKELRIEN